MRKGYHNLKAKHVEDEKGSILDVLFVRGGRIFLSGRRRIKSWVRDYSTVSNRFLPLFSVV